MVRDAKKATKLVSKAFAHRRALAEVARRQKSQLAPPAGSVQVGVYFADGMVNMYQMRQWFAPLEALNRQVPVSILARNPSAAVALMDETDLPVQFVPKVSDLERVLEQQPLSVMLYVNQNTRNFQMMRYGNRWHVFINHGESDKMYMSSNQYKTYDFAFVAGDAARKRLAQALWEYNVDERTFSIGRPQADYFLGEPPYAPDERVTVLYSPTWEGDRPAAAYGSVASHGVTLAEQLLASKRHRLVYRPHPRSGVVDDSFGEANEKIIALIAAANQADPSAQHVFDDSPTLGWQLSAPDVAICDISAMIYDRLALGKPLLVTRPVSADAEIDAGGYLSECDWLDASACSNIIETIDAALNNPEADARLNFWSAFHFGDTAPGAPTQRFHDAITELLSRAEAWRTGALKNELRA